MNKGNNTLQYTISGNIGAPYYYDYGTAINAIGLKPSAVHVHDNAAAYFYKRHLLQRAMSPFIFKLPENWDHDYFLYSLYCFGFVGVFDSGKFGVIPQGCGLRGYNVFYRPTDIIVTNPLLTRQEYKIGVDCEIVKLTPDYCGIMDTVEYYGNLLAVTYEALAMNVQNSKLSYVFAARDKKTSESLKKLFDNMQGGDLAAFYNTDLNLATGEKPWEVFEQNLRNNYIANEIMETMRDIFNQFDMEIGIANSGVTKKKERVINAEVAATDEETYSKVDLWFQTIKSGLDKVNDMFYEGRQECSLQWRHAERAEDAETDNNIDEYV